jgi:DNA-binding NtrC family response regulator
VKAKAPKRILVVDDEASVTGALAVILGDAGYDVPIAGTIAQAMSILSSGPVDLVITDLRPRFSRCSNPGLELANAFGVNLSPRFARRTNWTKCEFFSPMRTDQRY